jgi:hypothetical protein
VALLLLLAACATTSPSRFGLDPGPHRVGFRTEGTTTAWYPAGSKGETLRFRDYAGDTLDDADKFLHGQKMGDQAIVDLFDMPMMATRNARPDGKRYPLVVVNGAVLDHALVAEYLASHGFVVATNVAAAKWADVDSQRVRHIGNLGVKTWDFVVGPHRQHAAGAAGKLLKLVKSRA